MYSHNKKIRCLLLPFLLLFLLMSGCSHGSPSDTSGGSSAVEEPGVSVIQIGGQDVPLDTTELRTVITDGETELLSQLPGLRYVDLSGSENIEEIASWADAHPGVSVHYTVPLPFGGVLSSDTASYDLSDATAAEALAVAPALAKLPRLKTVVLGSERDSMGWDGIRQLREILQETEFQYAFNLYGGTEHPPSQREGGLPRMVRR